MARRQMGLAGGSCGWILRVDLAGGSCGRILRADLAGPIAQHFLGSGEITRHFTDDPTILRKKGFVAVT